MPLQATFGPTPHIIAHRGVPGERLEHTRPSYELAIAYGADIIEPDVVATSDGHLVVRHENEIGHTTDVADRPEFAGRRTTKLIDGVPFSGWFTEDFTLDEIKTLRCRERLPLIRRQNLALAGTEQVLTFAEVVQIARDAAAANPLRPIGLYPETKHPTYFDSIGLNTDDLLIAELERLDLNRVDADLPVVIQSFEVANLRTLRSRTPLPLMQLLDRAGAPFDFIAAGDPRTYRDLICAEALTELAQHVDGIGPNKSLVISRDKHHALLRETGLVSRAHQAGLFVHIWTMRNENNFLPTDYRVGDDKTALGDARAEYLRFFDAGVDGVFSDYADTAVRARADWRAGRSAAAGLPEA